MWIAFEIWHGRKSPIWRLVMMCYLNPKSDQRSIGWNDIDVCTTVFVTIETVSTIAEAQFCQMLHQRVSHWFITMCSFDCFDRVPGTLQYVMRLFSCLTIGPRGRAEMCTALPLFRLHGVDMSEGPRRLYKGQVECPGCCRCTVFVSVSFRLDWSK